MLLGTGQAAGNSAFKPPVIIAGAASFLEALAIGDFNGDTRPDVAATVPSADSAIVLLNDADWPALDVPSIAITDAASVTEGNSGTVSAQLHHQPVGLVQPALKRRLFDPGRQRRRR